MYARPLQVALIALFLCVNGAGCSVFMAATAPHKRNLAVLAPGHSRSEILQEIGPPEETRRTERGLTDTFDFKQGYTLPTRAARFIGHAAADVATAGIWEFVGTPIETTFNGEEVRAEVTYNDDEQAQFVEYLSGAHLHYGGPTFARWMRRKSTMQTAKLGDPPASDVMQASGILSDQVTR